ncbi:TlpA family protein disulfide reductase [Alkalilimnicola sp. S0819]|uniref:TlpA family protein disulfide reductase n=1 Tax=Alkalilimnicola sp. S0819 TaxID=2613922 RepID=UPI0012619567|nr:TlpA disulfide reductase family protein [Alkalilimnicola sp. S0819]KAB7627313.1 TlpA family protein disulfide reductase [Alkalilimnicola sp. S0819]MPQ16028.1 redoxin domain-containing protein [Alkalilimnicola sp. S0819]
MTVNRLLIPALLLLLALAAAFGGHALWRQLNAPDPAATPLPNLAGEVQSVAHWQGQPRVVNFWASWCPPCVKEIPVFVALQQDYEDQGLQVLGIAVDRADAAAAFAEKLEMNYPILHGVQDAMDLMAAWGNERGTLPYTVLLDAQGRVQKIFAQEVTRADIEPAVRRLLAE